MQLQHHAKNGYQVIQILDRVTGESDFSDLKQMVQQFVNQGQVQIAFSFTKESYFYSSAISALVQCLGVIREHNGKLAIIQPNEGMLDTLRIVGLTKMIETFTTEEKLGNW